MSIGGRVHFIRETPQRIGIPPANDDEPAVCRINLCFLGFFLRKMRLFPYGQRDLKSYIVGNQINLLNPFRPKKDPFYLSLKTNTDETEDSGYVKGDKLRWQTFLW